MPKLTVDLRSNETLTIGGATVRLDRKSGQIARLVIEAPADIRVVLPYARQGAKTRERDVPICRQITERAH